ncbi:MAG TPA: efflux RND transporter permease subunit [Kofleriaceae bacterium]|jgi:multidrug efflux pump subunit AcrB
MYALLRRYASVVWLLALALALLGVRALWSLPSGIYPELTFPRVVVVAHASELSTELVEAQVTRPLEAELATVPGVRRVRAKTIRGAVELSVQLTDGSDPLQAQHACESAIARVDLPKGTTTVVERVLPTSVPVITFNLAGNGVDPRRLRDLADLVVRPAFVRVAGVGGVEAQGGRVREASIQIKPTALAMLHITPSQLAAKLEAQDVLLSAGKLFDQHQTLPVVLDAQATDLEQLRALPIAQGPSGPIPLSAVADVVEGAEDPDVIVRSASGEIVAVSVARLPGASTVAVVDGILAAARDLRASGALPAGVELKPVYDQAALVTESLASVRDAILIGVALTLIVIALALRDPRAGLIAAIPIPIALLGTFALMPYFGITLNLMSLGGLAVAIGLVVDDTIVVTEGIVARLEQGETVARAIALGTVDMTAAVIGTTLTTVVVFAPLALLAGVTGSFLGAFALTLAIAVLLSMIASLCLIPLLASLLRSRPSKHVESSRIGTGSIWLLHRRVLAIPIVVLILVAGGLAQRKLATGFLPAMDEGAFVIDFFMPVGTSLEETDRISVAIDDVLAHTPEISAFTRRTGTELGPATATVQSRGDIMVALVDRSKRGAIDDIIAKVREELHDKIPEARFEYVQVLQDVLADLAGNPEPIELAVLGGDAHAVDEWAEKFGEELEKRHELVDVFDGREGQTPVLRSTINHAQLSQLGLDASTVGADLDIAIAGRDVGQILRPERVIGTRLRYPDAVRYSAPALSHSLMAYGPTSLPLEQVVKFDRPLSPVILNRDSLRPVLLVHAATPDGDLGAGEAAVREVLRANPPPRGVQIEVGGQAASGAASRRQLLAIAGLAMLLVLIVLSAQLRSLRLALVVLLTAPLSTVGGLIALAITHTPLDISSITGLILLVGLVVKNGILLLEHAEHTRAGGASVEVSLSAAVRRRARPILMTSAATLAGLLPLAIGFGSGSELQRPLAIAVIGGLALATGVTLFVTPALAALVLPKTSPSQPPHSQPEE